MSMASQVLVVEDDDKIAAPLVRTLEREGYEVRRLAEGTPALAALAETCRRIAQEKVKPRAREIDESGEYPQDLFEVFRDAGLLGLCIPEDLGGSGAGILGLTIAIEEVAKYSNTAALMLLLTRLPTGPVMIAGRAAPTVNGARFT